MLTASTGGGRPRRIADGVDQLRHGLRASFRRSLRQTAPVAFSGPLAGLFDQRVQAQLVELNTVLASRVSRP
ncbi:MAG TPA: hypothetical protein VF109_00530, partial [Mycobacteriales bacterium]